MRVLLATTGAALLAAGTPAAAAADAPQIALSSALGRLTLASSGGCTFGPIRSFCADPAAPSAIPGLPRLAVAPGAALTLKVDASWVGRPAVALDDASRSLDVVAAGAGRYRVEVPADLAAVPNVTIMGRWRAGRQHGDAIYFARLRAALAAAVGPRASLVGARGLRWAIACPARAGVGCSGTATLRTRTRPLVVARASFARLPPGKRRTFSARLGRAALRRLQERPRPVLRAVVRSPVPGGPRSVALVHVR